MIAVLFKLVDPGHPLMVMFDVFSFWFFELLLIYFMWRIFWRIIDLNAKKPKDSQM